MNLSTKTEDTNFLRSMPCNIIAEQMLLGTVLVDNEAVNKVNDFLRPHHFFDPLHQRIYTSVLNFIEKGIIANPVTLKNIFDKDPAVKERNQNNYLLDLASLSSTIINVTDYGKSIYDLALRRQLIGIGEEIVNDAFNKEEVQSSQKQIEVAEQKLYHIANDFHETTKGFLQIKSALNEAVLKAERAYKNKGKVSGIATDFIDLDEILGGLQNSDLFILAGRPAMGKTALAVNIALNCAKVLLREHALGEKNHESTDKNIPKSIGFFSLEMSSDQLASRMISMISNITTPNLRTGHLDEEEFGTLLRASKELQALPFYIDDTPSLSISAIRTRARRLKRKNNLGLLIIDYLQLIRGVEYTKDSNRVQEISEVTQGLKAIAKELDIPVIALSQLSRAVEQRDDKRPLLSDLRESGSIEQDADIVAFIYRESYYLMRKKPPKQDTPEYTAWQQDMNNVSNMSEVIIAKHRNGPTGDVKLFFDSHITKFSNFSQTHGNN